jgi:hypothetical protein
VRVTKRKISAALRDAIFTPSEDGSMKIIVDVGDMDYYIRRAQECLHKAIEAPLADDCKNHLKMALQLTALASVHNAES